MIRLGILLGAFALSAATHAQVQVPHEFQSNTPARAAEVNANFDALEGAIASNSADISSNAASIVANEGDIQSVNAAVSALGDGGSGLSVLFHNAYANVDSCEFAFLHTRNRFAWNQGAQRIDMFMEGGGTYMFILTGIATLSDARPYLIDLMIRIGSLPLAVDDFRDATTNEFDCTNEKLLSLL